MSILEHGCRVVKREVRLNTTSNKWGDHHGGRMSLAAGPAIKQEMKQAGHLKMPGLCGISGP